MSERREKQRDQTREEIKNLARQQMAAEGTGAISLRGIARTMGLTAPALYRYYPNRDALITALIVEAFNGLADALEATQQQHADHPITDQLLAVMLAYREWALANRTDFALIYGTPIVGYAAPAEITVPAATRTFRVIVQMLAQGLQTGAIQPQPPYNTIPPQIERHLQAMQQREGYQIPLVALYLGITGWMPLHGMIMLELFNHIQPVVGDVETFYRSQLKNFFQALGLKS